MVRIHRWWLFIVAISVAGLLLRLVPVLAEPHLVASGDPSEYWLQSNLIAAGKGWVEPYRYLFEGQRLQTASLPPLYTLALVPCSLLGLKSFFTHRVWSCVISALAIPLAGKVTRDIDGPTSGLLAAVLTAVYPNIWVGASTGMSETLTPLVIFGILWCSFRAWRRPTGTNLAIMGLILGLATLSRTDGIVLAGILLVTLAVRRRQTKDSFKAVVWGIVGLLVVIAPLATYNSVRLRHPVFVTDEFGIALSQANNNLTYGSGRFAGFWVPGNPTPAPPNGNEAEASNLDEHQGLAYIRAHADHLPTVGLQRLGRTFGMYRPAQQISLDILLERRPHAAAWVGLWSYYGLLALSLPGYWLLRRRGVWMVPFMAVAADVVLSTVITYGDTRFRTPLEPVLVILGAVALAKLIEMIRGEVRSRSAHAAS